MLISLFEFFISNSLFQPPRMDEKGKDFLGCSEDVLHRNERSNTVQHCTEDNWPSVVLSLSQVCKHCIIVLGAIKKSPKLRQICEYYFRSFFLLGARIAWPSFSLFGG